jgi:acetyl esterase/lipase
VTELAVSRLRIMVEGVHRYVHGGAFALCSASTHRLITFELVRRTGAVVLAPNYVRPPRARFPTQARPYEEAARSHA